MTLRKTTSTNFQNEQGLVVECPMTYTYTLLGKRWKPIILWKINEKNSRFSELLKTIPLISRKMLFQELAELQERNLVEFDEKNENKIYHLTPLGNSLLPILQAMWNWGEKNRPD